MAHFAELDENNIVRRVIVVNNSDVIDSDGNESEQVGINFCHKLFGNDTRWVQTSFNATFRGHFAKEGMSYLSEYDAFMPPKPYPWYEYENYSWYRPVNINDNTGLPFTDSELRYIGFFSRHTKGYRLLPAVLKDPRDELTSKACLTTSYMYPTFETITYGTNSVAQSVPHSIEGDKVVVNTNFTMSKYLDVTPVALVIKTTFEVLNNVTIPIMNMHPQTAARTPHELFRLIIEWALAYTEFGNQEKVAITCHNVLRAIQMPLEVRNELLTQVEPQAVERYIRGLDPFYATDESIVSDPPMPPLFEVWIRGARDYFKYKPKDEDGIGFNNEVINIENMPESYPV